MASTSEPLTATEQVVTLASADTEFSITLPVGTKYFSIQCRTAVACRFSFTTGKVATPTDPYSTLKSGQSYSSPEKFSSSGARIIYFATSDAGSPVIECLSWQAP